MSAGRPRDPEIDDAIVAATRALLIEGGMKSLSIAKVAARSGISRPTVYRRYADKTALVREVLFADIDAVIQRVGAAVQEEQASTIDRLVALCRPMWEYYQANPALSRTLLKEFVLEDDPAHIERSNAQAYGYVALAAQVVAEGQTRGAVREAVDPEMAANAFFAYYFMVGLGGLNGLYPDVEAQEQVMRALLGQLLDPS